LDPLPAPLVFAPELPGSMETASVILPDTISNELDFEDADGCFPKSIPSFWYDAFFKFYLAELCFSSSDPCIILKALSWPADADGSGM